MFKDSHFLKWETHLKLVEVRLEEFLLVGNSLHEYFLLNDLPFLE